MRRQQFEDEPGAVFHVSARVNWQKFLFAADRRRQLVLRSLRAACEAYGVEILGYVVMSNHFHAVLRCPSKRLFTTLTTRVTAGRHRRPWPPGHQNASVLAQCMRAFMRTVSRAVHEQNQVTGRLWEESYHARRIPDAEYLCTALAYDHLNPVKARLVEHPEDYAWSSARLWGDGGPPLWAGHGFREMPFALGQAEFAARLAARQTDRGFLESLRRLERQVPDWTMPGGFEEFLLVLQDPTRGADPGSATRLSQDGGATP